MFNQSIKRATFVILFLFALSFVAFPPVTNAADDYQLVFATPPITKPIQSGQTARRIDLTYMRIDMPGNAITGIGVNGAHKEGTEQGGSTTTWNIFSLSDENNTIYGIMGGAGFGGEGRLTPGGDSLFFFGMDVNAMILTIDMAFGDMTMTSLGLSPQGGFQHHFHIGNAMLTPYVSYNYNMSYYMTSFTPSGGGNSTSDSDTMSYGMTTIGFDVMLPGGLSLASMLTSGSNDNMTMIKIGYNY